MKRLDGSAPRPELPAAASPRWGENGLIGPGAEDRWAEVDLGAIRENVAELLRRLPAGTRMLAVVKADGYGHGALPVAQAALEGGAWGLAVATLDEAVEVRELCPPERILVMGGLLPPQAPAAAALGCAVGCSGIELAQALEAAGGRRRLPVHLKVDTGMGRFGCAPADAIDLARYLAHSARLELAGTWTHFASAENDPAFTQLQFARF